jgi:hypothetical protein
LTVFWGQISVASRDHAIAVDCATPHWAILWPALWGDKQTFDEPLGNPPVVSYERQIDMDQRICCGDSFPRRSDTSKAVNDPFLAAEEISVSFEILLMRDFATTGLKLN